MSGNQCDFIHANTCHHTLLITIHWQHLLLKRRYKMQLLRGSTRSHREDHGDSSQITSLLGLITVVVSGLKMPKA